MSHISQNKTNIRAVNENVLQTSLELIARVTPGIDISTRPVTSDVDEKMKCDVSIRTKALPRGLGLQFKHGEGLVFVGDDYCVEEEYSKLQKLILMTYQTVAAQRAFEDMGYTTNIVAERNNRVTLEAVGA